ncbi:hypothetical protein [Pseudobacter ginsenosidimutans]|uniref:Uncharacterized protein n=1 Tax=Pseudobacter ginsenosidimutans TaxID=661488 RepID=A0A4Q7MR88_9BACT|nr:hypothetical protein [Pseudobacter ginsenosidimutans]QEC41902.1 hypothetical protein FSB84_09465 [Pseudobacter ginsenosidimutans]RZS71272.1 hypothetical protein EV199_3174 [Pseudobacter ginsenosidimutans]
MNFTICKYLPIAALAGLLAIVAAGCSGAQQDHIVTPAFYFWKSQAVLNPKEQNILLQTADKLYVKFFDVAWNAPQQTAIPTAKVQFGDSTRRLLSSGKTELVPTVFITNETMMMLDSVAVVSTAVQIAGLIETIRATELSSVPVKEIQIDCDWTATTRDRYFLLLRKLKEHPGFQGKLLSATIRLYQCKYKLKTGVPPIDRGLLMCYNMGNLKNPLTKNSILDPEEMEKYTTNLHEYPLDLDVALPIFNWKVLFRKNEYAGLIQNLPTENLDHKLLTNREGNTYRLLKDTVLLGYDLHKDDLIRQEDSNFGDILRSARILKKKIRNEKLTLSLYHLDSITLDNYSTHEIQTIFLSLH